MNSLIEATRFNVLRSQLQSVKQRKAGGTSRMISDLISEKFITLEEAEEMLELYAATTYYTPSRLMLCPTLNHQNIVPAIRKSTKAKQQ
jgi:hypothetical protein